MRIKKVYIRSSNKRKLPPSSAHSNSTVQVNQFVFIFAYAEKLWQLVLVPYSQGQSWREMAPSRVISHHKRQFFSLMVGERGKFLHQEIRLVVPLKLVPRRKNPVRPSTPSSIKINMLIFFQGHLKNFLTPPHTSSKVCLWPCIHMNEFKTRLNFNKLFINIRLPTTKKVIKYGR